MRQTRVSETVSGLPRRSCQYDAYIPDLLADRVFRLDGEVAADVADAGDVGAQEVLGNLEAVASALALAEANEPITVDALLEIHRRLLEGSTSPPVSRPTLPPIGGSRRASVSAVLLMLMTWHRATTRWSRPSSAPVRGRGALAGAFCVAAHAGSDIRMGERGSRRTWARRKRART